MRCSLFIHTAGDDYTAYEDDLTLDFPEGAPTSQCVIAWITNDTITLEDDETFMFFLEDLPEGVVPGDNPESTVTIVDDDDDGEH